MKPELVFLSPFFYQKLKIGSFCVVKCNFELIFLKNLNLKTNYTKNEQILPNIPCSHKTFEFYAGRAF